MSKNHKPPIDPVILMTLGLVLITLAVVMAVLPSDAPATAIATNSGILSQLAVAFVTGLTTGGLSCLAVQGGLLASSLAHQIEKDYLEQADQPKKQRGKKNQPVRRSGTAIPILLFLSAKTVAYT
ncbi:MAG TPA: hypothetical protein VK900_22460, partial [Anaerolineales bacterium]|nr:hypothetical protein [Anaerolineales bacterium]